MSRLVATFGTSHSIMLNASLEDLRRNFPQRDRTLTFYDRAGRPRTFDEAAGLAPANAAELIAPERLGDADFHRCAYRRDPRRAQRTRQAP